VVSCGNAAGPGGPGGPARGAGVPRRTRSVVVWLRVRVSSCEQKADVGRQVARLAWWASGDAGRGRGRVRRKRVRRRGPLPAGRKCLLGTSGPGRPVELFLARGTYLAELACRSGRMSYPASRVELRAWKLIPAWCGPGPQDGGGAQLVLRLSAWLRAGREPGAEGAGLRLAGQRAAGGSARNCRRPGAGWWRAGREGA
jgi:hypothetical protein